MHLYEKFGGIIYNSIITMDVLPQGAIKNFNIDASLGRDLRK